jgi:hypothetical protein
MFCKEPVKGLFPNSETCDPPVADRAVDQSHKMRLGKAEIYGTAETKVAGSRNLPGNYVFFFGFKLSLNASDVA